jgi:hypothetical protein
LVLIKKKSLAVLAYAEVLGLVVRKSWAEYSKYGRKSVVKPLVKWRKRCKCDIKIMSLLFS